MHYFYTYNSHEMTLITLTFIANEIGRKGVTVDIVGSFDLIYILYLRVYGKKNILYN